MFESLHTERLSLQPPDRTRDVQILNYLLRNEAFLKGWDPARAPDFYTLDTQRRLIEVDLLQTQAGQLAKFWIYKRGEPERIIGSVSLSNIVRGAFQSCHLGYRLDRDELNKGYMTEAVGRVVRHGFEELMLHRIEANIMPRNGASLKVVEKLGFEREGLARRYLRINGKWEDHIHMVLLNERMEEDE